VYSFKEFDKVRHKYDRWEGFIDTITPHGKIRVKKINGGYEWVYPNDIELCNSQHEKVSRKTDIRFFG